jgi:hypothetical protein
MRFGTTPESEAAAAGKMAVRHLAFYSPLPALALRNELRKSEEPVEFPGQAVFEQIAHQAGLFVSVVVHPSEGAFEHVLFLTKIENLADAELLSCRRPRSFNRFDPKGPREPV